MKETFFYNFSSTINAVSIPLDSIYLISLLIVFGGFIYLFNLYIERESKKAIIEVQNNRLSLPLEEKIDDKFSFQLESRTNFFPRKIFNIKKLVFDNTKLLGIGALAFLALGSTSAIVMEKNSNLIKGIKKNHLDNTEKAYTEKNEFLLRISDDFKLYDHGLKTKISYINPIFVSNPSMKISYENKVPRTKFIF